MIDSAPAGSTITFDANLRGTILLTNDLTIGKRLSIHGPGAGHVTMNGNPNDEFSVDVSPNGSVTIADLAFKSSLLYNWGTLTLNNSTVSGNSNSSNGGGIDNWGTLTLNNSTISDNRAERPGGGILNTTASAQTEMIFCTIYGNTSNESGGGIWNGVTNSGSQLVMGNSLVAGNKSPAGPDILGSLTSRGYNLIQNTMNTTFAPNQAHGTDLLQVAPTSLGVDPLLGNNNGPTQTHALLPGSVVIDRIPLNDCRIKDISTDQRGVRRPQGAACDIGAYELRE